MFAFAKRIIGKIRGSKDGKTLVRNFGFLSVLEVTTKIFPLITLPYLARVLGVECFGVLAIGTAVVAYFQSVTNYSFEYRSVRDAARVRGSIEDFSKIVSLTFFSKALLMLLSILLLSLLTCTIPFMRQHAAVIWFTFLIIPSCVLNTDWVFQALEDMKYITIRSVSARLLFTVLVFVLIKSPDDYLMQPILTAFGSLVPCLWGIAVLRKKYGVRFYCPKLAESLRMLREGFNLFVTLFLPTIYTQLNTLLLGTYNGKAATGIYSGGTRFTSLSYSLFQIVSRTFYPFFARRMDKHKLYVKFTMLVALCISLVFFFFAKPLVHVFLGQEFYETIKVLRIVAFTPIAVALMNCYGTNYLVLKGQERTMRNIIIVVTVIGLIFGIVGAKEFSYVGVAVASLVTQMIRGLLVFYYARKLEKNAIVEKHESV